MKTCLVPLFMLAIIFLSCERSTDKDLKNQPDFPNKDSLLIDYISKGFDYEEPYQRQIPSQLKKIRSGEYNHHDWSRDTILGEYRLKSFNFDIIGYCPFVIEVTKARNEFACYFTFTDELYYLHNDFDMRLGPDSLKYYKSEVGERDLLKKINLEKNFNALIDTLGFQHDQLAVQNLIEIVFHDLLNMKRTDEKKAIVFIESKEFHDRYAAKFGLDYADHIVETIKKEHSLFNKTGNGRTDFIFQSQEGTLGFWKFWIVETDGSYRLKASFFSDFAFQAMWL